MWSAEERKKPHPERSNGMRRERMRGERLRLFSKGSKIRILFGDICPRLVQANGGLYIRAGFIEVTQLAMVTTQLKFDMRIIWEFALSFEKDRAALLDRILVSDGVGKRNPNLWFLRPLTPQLLSRFTKFYKPTRSTENPRAQKIQSQAVIPLAAGLRDATESLVEHP
jgi:hypothetical protein